ncbi:DUF6493 family protein [Dactylosporangium sp. NPDC048998]|uniref:DUF6493 family protein n=1 Tax=Dactylosporangium sp. NPDC048998 TaxID=3363976 RepID=UPI00371F0061
MFRLDDLLAAPDETVVPMLCDLDGPAQVDLARQVDAAFAADIEARVHGRGAGPVLTDRDRRRLRLARIATVSPGQGLPRDDEEIRVAVARGRRYVQAAAEAAVRWMAGAADLGWAFVAVRELERRGEVTLPADDDYVLAVIGSFVDAGRWAGGHFAPRSTPTGRIADRLRAEPDLLAKVFWRLFEVDRERAPSLAGTDRFLSRPGATWREAVLDLLAAGVVDRERVLNATLTALGRATSGFRAGWFVGLHRELAPTVAEAAARQPAYDLLLRSPIGPVVAVGLDAFRALRAAGTPVDPPSLPAAVQAPGKAVALKALRLGGVPLAGAALDHPHPDVRAAAARLLGRPAPASVMPSSIPAPLTLPPLVPAMPIVDHAELAEALAVLVEDPTDADLAERALCAAARLGPDPEGLRTVARRVVRRTNDLPVEMDVLAIVGMVVTAAAGQRRFRDSPVPAKAGLLAARAREIADTLLAGHRFAPLAEPTHAGGWVDPKVLVARLTAGGPVEHRPADAVAALLRLGPDPAASGPGLAAEVPGAFGAALRYALGGPPPTTVTPADAPLWVAAARARAPYDDDAALIVLGLDEVGAGRAPALVPRLLVDGGIGFRAVMPARRTDPDALLPTVALSTVDDHLDRYLAAAWWPWLATTWPGNLGVPAALVLVQWPAGEVGRFTGEGVLRPLLGARVTVPPVARVLVAAVLGAERLADRVAGADAVHDLVPARLAPAELGAAMGWLAPAVPLQRWTSALRAVAESGRSPEVAGILGTLLPTLKRSRAGLFGLVELLVDTAVPVPEGELRRWLAEFTGTSKAAKAARAARALS